MTLTGLERQAYDRGFQDAISGRVYRASFNPGDRLRTLELHADYEAGWKDGRKEMDR